MEEAYAQALWRMVEEGMAPKQAVAKVHASLKKSGREALLPRIARAFARLAGREHQKSGITLVIAREKDARKAQHTAKALLEELGAKEREIEVLVDESLIGGWRLEGRETLVDASFKKQLLTVYNRATRN